MWRRTRTGKTNTQPPTPHVPPYVSLQPPPISLPYYTPSGSLGKQDLGPYDDEETRAFYEDLPDLLATLPPALLGLTEEEAARLRAENAAAMEGEQEIEEEVRCVSVCVVVWV